ncbi:unnamed protein product [Clonostachys rosea f. rosea IK726]|uniref:Uncharacterized protein n=1 Tax=Clonostachys rosea f. rosea IK726 TaxID=1349383 RepID=A0ACA9TYC3_BIOOC|nr:unnamed protein product [Clonostachys rosea f. rosea IK726]
MEGFTLHDLSSSSRPLENVYIRPDLDGVDQFLKSAEPIPTSLNNSPTEIDVETDMTANFAVIHNLNFGTSSIFGPSNSQLVEFSSRDFTRDGPSLLFMRGFASAQWLVAVQDKFNASPSLYGRHLADTPFATVWRDLHALPPLPSSSACVFQLQIPTICFRDMGKLALTSEDLQAARQLESGIMKSYLRQLREKATTGDSIVRGWVPLSILASNYLAGLWTRSTTEYLEYSQSMESFRVVASMANTSLPCYCSPSIRFHTATYFDTKCRRYDNPALIKPTFHQPGVSPKVSQNACLLPFHYGSQLDRAVAHQDALYALSELFQFSASSQVQVLNFLHYRIERELSTVAGDKTTQSLQTISLMNLRYIKRILKHHASNISEIVNLFETRASLNWPRTDDGALKPKAERKANLLLTDFRYLLQRAEDLVRECEQGMATLANTAFLEESRRSADMADKMGKLTTIATMFIPLAFVCSLWGMNFEEMGSGNKPIWWFAVTAVPVILVALVAYFSEVWMRWIARKK